MSLLIKGIEKPKAGETIIIAENVDRTIYGRLEHGDDWYPLIEVPTPHGRLIDAYTAIMLLQKYYDREQNVLKQHAIGECIMIIKDDAPTVIEAEEER